MEYSWHRICTRCLILCVLIFEREQKPILMMYVCLLLTLLLHHSRALQQIPDCEIDEKH